MREMGFLTRLLAGLLAASTLGTGLAGTTNAVDVTGAAGNTKSVVKLTADGGNETSEDTADNPDDDSTDADSTTDAGAQSDAGQQAEIQSSTSQDKATAKSSLPDHIVNGSFDYPACPDGKNSCDVDPTTGWGGFYVDYGRKFMPIPDWNRSKFGWDSSQEGLRPDQQPNSHQKLQHCVQIGNKPNNNGQKMNRFAEIIAETPDEYIYQDIATTPGVMYRWSLKHASEDASHVDSMQVTIGSPGKETAQDATRTTSNGRGDRTGVTSKTIATKGGQAEWETYTGVYIATSTVTRFTFKSAQGRDSTRGNFIDDVMFTKAYKLTYDKNSADASGQVPSNQRGKENTTQPAKNKTNGKIRLASDTSKLSDHLVNSDFEYLPDGGWKTVDAPSYMRNAYTSVDPNNGQYMRNAKHVDADLASWVDWPGFDQSKFAWKTDQKGGHDQGGLKDRAEAVELQQDSTDGNTYAEMVASETGRTIYQNLATIPGTLYKIRLKHASLCKDNVDQMQVVINGTPIEMTRVTANGKAGDKVGEKSTTIGTRVTNENRWHHSDQWETYEGYYVIPDGQTTTRFGFKAVNYLDPTKGNLLDDVTFARAYKLSYDKNSTDATGEVPSNQRGKENTTQPAKTKTNGTVKTVADTNASLPDHLVNGDFEYPGVNVLSKNRYDEKDNNWWGVSRKDRMVYDPFHEIQWVSLPSTFDSDRFAWDSTEVAGTQNGSSQWHTNEVELQRDSHTGNMYGELCAYQAHTSIRQYIRTTPGALYKVRLKHASLSRDYLDKMQVLVGPAGNEQPVSMTRVESQNGLDATGQSTTSTTVSTHASNEMEIKDGQGTHYSSRNHDGQWATYEGVYVATSDVTSFTFKSVDAKAFNLGNLLDDIVFDKAYKLTYDANSSDASGQVPSDTAANTVKQAKSKTNGTVRLASDDDVVEYAANGLPKQIVNSDFDHDWRNIVGQSKMTGKYNFANIDPAHGDVEISGPLNGKGEASKQWVHLNGFDASQFGWKSNQTDTRVDGRGGIVEIQRSRANDNMYAEITASQADTYLYQDIDTAHDYPTVYTVKLRYAHRNGTINSNEKIQILVGAPGHEQPVEMTRIASDRGNRLGEKSTTVNAPNTDGWLGSWDTFQGSVVVPAGQNVSRFTFKALGSIDGISGNLIDDVQFKLAYKLSYDKNAQDAFGQVPSDETANTVKQAKTRTTGTVRAVADRTASGLTVHDLETDDVPGDYRQFVLNTTDTRLSQVEFEDGAWYRSTDSSSQGMWPLKAGASLTIPSVGDWTDPSGRTHQISMTMRLKEWNGGSVSELYRFDGHGNIVGDGRFWINTAYGSGYSSLPAKVEQAMGGVDTSKRVGCSWTVEFTYADTGEKVPDTFKGVTGFNDLDGWDAQSDLKFEGVQLLSGFDGAYKRSDAELGTYGTNGFAGIKHDAGDEAYLDAPQQSRHRLAATWTGSTFTFSYDLGNPAGRTDGSRMTFGAPVTRTAVLTYDKNAAGAAGSVPSDTTPGTTRTVSSKTDGKVSDLVQRTTTHEDGSVTVRTVDQSTDVVSGCQVYYPAGQRITLATMAKDDDCWDSSMLSRPGHTQLGWNQDRNATQAQAEVTMVEGGMTVFAVWVGNPVLTYDTNKPSTWSGEMPSTPASVSVPYNTAAADGSGWQAGDVSKLRGYKFLGWYTGPQDNAGLYDWTRPLTGSVTVYAHWQRLQANVIYDANGGTGSHANTTGWQYSDVTIPGDTSKSFTRDGYVFKGWSLKAGKADVVYKDGSQIPLQDKDITLYAQWQGIHENFTETGGISLPLLIAGGIGLLVMGVGSTVMLTRRMNGHGMPDGE
ncbi:InlB B-repeat-containing protein [Bifidobacterium adolescentis]|nr:InlB B-repeat-containing protein [Bifidobacterium adolescentis]KAB5651321.1 InlB B-repeat-containing protein [Bifidobacterium adolescentis]KAB5662078.1 InlB B-repeat-containing protein [Bifidobacterium adolescentis]KAB5684113.1 InlB B-repeat-containing protein [Bifidobacterium adolescentis]KAB5687867.1 InlB B-repeat-containing protein [Bifidobacterium adolescentis]